MRIISQSRLISLNFDNIGIFIDGSVICTKIDGNKVSLGKYKSDERAKEVFTKMHDNYLLAINETHIYALPLS